jgi:hypothetical protein
LVDAVAGPVANSLKGRAPEERSERNTTDKLFDIQPMEIQLPAVRETMEEKIKRVAITDEERVVITEMASLAGRSPRAVKRLINVYRFVRSLYRGADLDVFLGRAGTKESQPLYPGVLFWLALDSGMRSEQVQRIRAAVALMGDPGCLIGDLLVPVRKELSKSVAKRLPDPARANLDGFWQSVPREEKESYIQAFEALRKRLPRHSGFLVLKETREQTIRFSFAGMLSERTFTQPVHADK